MKWLWNKIKSLFSVKKFTPGKPKKVDKNKGIVVHCSATKIGMDWGVKEIDELHRSFGWNGCGYHYVVRTNAAVEKGRSVRPFRTGAHTKGHNNLIGVCWIGGFDKDHRPNSEQYNSLVCLVGNLCVQQDIPLDAVHPHSKFANKRCPNLDWEIFIDDVNFHIMKKKGSNG